MDKFYAVRLLGLASNFWQLTLNVAKELIARENPTSMSYSGWEWPSKDEYEEHMRWSDINIIEPTLFNFYHGMELSLKALIHAKGYKINNNHCLSDLLNTVSSLYLNEQLIGFYEKYILLENLPLVLKEFCSKSNMTMDFFFQSLKYPSSTKGTDFSHSLLRARGEEGVKFFEALQHDLRIAREHLERLVIAECQDVLT